MIIGRALTREERTYRVSLFYQTLIISTQTDKKENGGNILKARNPFPSLASLPTHIDQYEFLSPYFQMGLVDARGTCPTVDNVL